jgi:ABC-type nickel/cobalt efflux system permease component RcnA
MAPIGRAWLIIALACFVGTVAALLTVTPARADSLRGEGAAADAPAATAAPSLLHRGMVQFVRLQRDVNRALSDGIVAIKEGRSSSAVLVAMLIAFAYGVLHALGPGHGKAVILGYFLSREGSIRRGLRMGAQIALLHVISAVVIVVVVRWLLAVTFAQPVDQLQILKLFSYSAITAIGSVMLARALWAVRRSGGAVASHGHDCHHHHRVDGARDLLSVAVGLIPCSGAVLVLIYALANGLLLSGLVMAACIAIGMALTLSAIGIAAVWMRARAVGADRPAAPARRPLVQAFLDVLGPLLITALGAVLLLSTVA